MSKFDREKYKELLNTCSLVQKRVLKKELSRNKSKHIEYTTILTDSYNELSAYIQAFYDKFDAKNQQILRNAWVQVRDKVNQCFGKILNDFMLPTEINQSIDLRN